MIQAELAALTDRRRPVYICGWLNTSTTFSAGPRLSGTRLSNAFLKPMRLKIERLAIFGPLDGCMAGEGAHVGVGSVIKKLKSLPSGLSGQRVTPSITRS